ncbi:hypothetical protein KKF05_01815 [Patescibacteria group bacterium]|nr:hypothetical protein [Patescibacteria group bacterium]
MHRSIFTHRYEEVISLENFLEAWREFTTGKRSRADVQEFERNLMENLISLHDRLATMTYQHAPYEAFTINDPKTRNIHKASVTDRVLHAALYRKLYPFFDRTFIADAYSCRIGKGTHRALDQFRRFACEVSQNHRKTAWVLKCDVRKFFPSIDQRILLEIVDGYIADKRIVSLLAAIVRSFHSGIEGIGLPLGNLTSQLLANVYLNVLDQFVKHRLKAERYIRYADDFVLFSHDKEYLECVLPALHYFLWQRLRLRLHPDKVFIETVASGVDFLGWVHFPDHRIVRPATRRRMMQRVSEHPTEETLQSYLGLMKHGNTLGLRDEIKRLQWLHADSDNDMARRYDDSDDILGN